jgi:predicted transcriptional regulator
MSLVSLDHVVEIVAAYVSHNAVGMTDLTKVIGDVHRAIVQLATGATVEPVVALVPAVSIRQSIKPDFIVCLEDGKKFKSLKRHLTLLGMTPDEYRAKWGLPADYPMVAATYATARSQIAKATGLGRKREPVKAKGKVRRAAVA